MKKMRIRIGRDGRATMTVEGAAGLECLEFTKLVEEALGTVEKRDLTEAYEKDPLAAGVSQELTEEETL